MKLKMKDRTNIKIIIEKYESDIEVYTYIVRLLKKVLKEETDN
ncbi:hypothetical protein P7D93_19075 [Enterococcus raffinosus]|nr:hypothetical protein [Enterococcus raffinosus]MDT2531966.1 hypothetical protein [Enterococcus raffinosus]